MEKSPSPQGYDELERLGKRLRGHGRLHYVTLEDKNYGGPILLISRKHVPETIIAAPGTHIPRHEAKDELDNSWRVHSLKRGVVAGVGLTNIVVNLPGEIADWVVDTHRNIYEQGIFEGEEQNDLFLELRAAENFVEAYDGPDYRYWGDRNVR